MYYKCLRSVIIYLLGPFSFIYFWYIKFLKLLKYKQILLDKKRIIIIPF